MTEKAYKAMTNAGITGLVIGVISIVAGVAAGVVLIITSAKLFKAKRGLTF